MGYVLLAGVALIATPLAYQGVAGLRASARTKLLRWGLGGGAALVTVFLVVIRRVDLAVFSGAAAYSVLRYGRLGPFTLDTGSPGKDTVSKVRSRYFAMELNHDSGAVSGRVIAGRFRGADLIDLGELDTRSLIEEVRHDPDSLSVLESWLNANRAGWREHFEETYAKTQQSSASTNSESEALAVLGLRPGASADEIRAAHHKLMKGVHPDRGGSDFLAAKINEARDCLLKSAKSPE